MIDLTEEIMKKITTILLTLLLGFAMAGCTTQDDAGTPEDVVNPTNLTFSLTNGTDNPDVENFTTIDADPFIAEEGSTVLEATELYCMSHDMSITIEKMAATSPRSTDSRRVIIRIQQVGSLLSTARCPMWAREKLPLKKVIKLLGILLTFRHTHGRLCIKNLFRKFLRSSRPLHIPVI